MLKMPYICYRCEMIIQPLVASWAYVALERQEKLVSSMCTKSQCVMARCSFVCTKHHIVHYAMDTMKAKDQGQGPSTKVEVTHEPQGMSTKSTVPLYSSGPLATLVQINTQTLGTSVVGTCYCYLVGKTITFMARCFVLSNGFHQSYFK